MTQTPTSENGTPAVLVCEDDPLQGRVLQEFLEKAGWSVCGPFDTAEDSAASARTENLCAAILDVSLDGGSSAETASVLRERGIPFAFVTGYGSATAATLGAFSEKLVVPKPVSPDHLEQIMSSLVGEPPRNGAGNS